MSLINSLDSELPRLVRDKIIDEDIAQKIKSYYGINSGAQKLNISTIIFAILGTVLVVSGIMLLIAHNWSGFSRLTKTIISVLPLVAGLVVNGWLIWKKSDSTPWKEAASLFWMGSIGISIDLISQTYHIFGSTDRFLMTWLLLSLPIVFLYQSISTIIGYFLCATWWVTYSKFSVSGSHVHLFYLFIFPMLLVVRPILKAGFLSKRANILLWALVPIGSLGISSTLDYSHGIWLPLFALYFSALYLLKQEDLSEISFWKKPLRFWGGISNWILLLVLSYRFVWERVLIKHIDRYRYLAGNPKTYIGVDFCILIVLTLLTIYLVRKIIQIKAYKKEDFALGVTGIVTLFAYVIGKGISKFDVTILSTYILTISLFFSLVILGIGLVRLVFGIRQLDYFKLNSGLAMIASILLLRFFDTDVSFTLRGGAFIVIGFGFWAVNARVSKMRSLQHET